MYNYLFPPPRSTRLRARLPAARRERWLLGTPPARAQLPLHRCQTKPAHHTQNSYINTQSHRVHRRKSESAGIEAPQSRQCRGGVRRGRDIFKALARGAKAVLVGRPLIYGLAAGGEEGVKRVIELLEEELVTCMQLCGCQTVEQIDRSFVVHKSAPPPHQ